ncbi:hypothetical protein [Flavobacterium sp. Arc2]|uniref:hypothetical protein n=1 Tax=Flavobacterium sp. Arc2 TaxID=3046685 RepID=UPI00352D521E
MKTSLKIFSALLFFFSVQTKAQTVSVTLQYLKNNFELKKGDYIGKPFSVLLKDLNVKPTETFHVTPFRKKNSVIGTYLYYFKKVYNATSSRINLYLTWQEQIPKETVRFYEKKNNYLFTNEMETFYANKIIKNIEVYGGLK